MNGLNPGRHALDLDFDAGAIALPTASPFGLLALGVLLTLAAWWTLRRSAAQSAGLGAPPPPW